jgi:uncharacterized protein YbcI
MKPMEKFDPTEAQEFDGVIMRGQPTPTKAKPTGKSDPAVAREIARVARAFEEKLTGRAPQAVTVVLTGETLVITLHGALSPAERALAQTPAGAAEVQEFHRELFASSFDDLRQELKRITGVDVREAAAEVEPATGTVVRAFTNGTVVQVFLLADSVPTDVWNAKEPVHQT